MSGAIVRLPRGAGQLVLLVALGCGDQRSSPQPGTDLYALDPNGVTELAFSSAKERLFAYRWMPRDSFRVVIAARGSDSTQQCAGHERFARFLHAITTMPVRERQQTSYPDTSGDWGDLRLRDASGLDPIEVRLRIPTASEPVVIAAGDAQYRVALDASALREIRSLCAEPVGSIGARARR